MNRFFVKASTVIFLMFIPMLSGCTFVKNTGRDAVAGAWEEVEARLSEKIDLAKKYMEAKTEEQAARLYEEEIKWAIDHDFEMIDVDPNLDGELTMDEIKSWEGKRLGYIAKDVISIATNGFLQGKDKEEIMADVRSKYPNLWEAIGGSGMLSAVLIAGLNWHRNKTRKTDPAVSNEVAANGNGSNVGTIVNG